MWPPRLVTHCLTSHARSPQPFVPAEPRSLLPSFGGRGSSGTLNAFEPHWTSSNRLRTSPFAFLCPISMIVSPLASSHQLRSVSLYWNGGERKTKGTKVRPGVTSRVDRQGIDVALPLSTGAGGNNSRAQDSAAKYSLHIV